MNFNISASKRYSIHKFAYPSVHLQVILVTSHFCSRWVVNHHHSRRHYWEKCRRCYYYSVDHCTHCHLLDLIQYRRLCRPQNGTPHWSCQKQIHHFFCSSLRSIHPYCSLSHHHRSVASFRSRPMESWFDHRPIWRASFEQKTNECVCVCECVCVRGGERKDKDKRLRFNGPCYPFIRGRLIKLKETCIFRNRSLLVEPCLTWCPNSLTWCPDFFDLMLTCCWCDKKENWPVLSISKPPLDLLSAKCTTTQPVLTSAQTSVLGCKMMRSCAKPNQTLS